MQAEVPLGEYKKAYASAKLVAPEAAIQRHGDSNLQFDGGKFLCPERFDKYFSCFPQFGDEIHLIQNMVLKMK